MRRVLVMVAMLLACSGCALTIDTESIGYHSQPGVAMLPGAGPVSISTVDSRPGNHAQFSNKKNAFGATMAPILADRPTSDVVQEALIEELRHRGFSIGSGGPSLTVTMRQFSSDFDVGFFGADANSVVSFTVEVRSPEGISLYTNAVTGKGVEPSNQVFNGRNARNAVEAALADAMRELMNDPTLFQALSKRSPSAA